MKKFFNIIGKLFKYDPYFYYKMHPRITSKEHNDELRVPDICFNKDKGKFNTHYARISTYIRTGKELKTLQKEEPTKKSTRNTLINPPDGRDALYGIIAIQGAKRIYIEWDTTKEANHAKQTNI
jgi:hypothetical protein